MMMNKQKIDQNEDHFRGKSYTSSNISRKIDEYFVQEKNIILNHNFVHI